MHRAESEGHDVSDDDDDLVAIRANAQMVIEQLGPRSGVEAFGFDAASVAWIDGFIERQRVRTDVDAEFVPRLTTVIGSYLGEAVIRTYGGKWVVSADGWCVEFSEGNACFPFTKVAKQFANGATDSVYSLFTVIPRVLLRTDPPEQQATGARPRDGWWARVVQWLGRRTR